MKEKTDAVYPLTPAADYSTKRGYLVDVSSDTATISTSATTIAAGVILDGETTTGKCSVALLGGGGSVKIKLGGTVTKGALVKQHTDGTVIADASGARVVVGRAMESGVADELIEIALLGPIPYAS